MSCPETALSCPDSGEWGTGATQFDTSVDVKEAVKTEATPLQVVEFDPCKKRTHLNAPATSRLGEKRLDLRGHRFDACATPNTCARLGRSKNGLSGELRM
ncbi:hypothetical protein [Cupriavidus sp. UYPR2.512]|uniref:hypothetical protein n=1 Tax=Cupriavidus sp. UYPR2.512 TaxID=1080187 RepID=UPI0012FA3862|nr:hypothetical protein [Cupriavidus sp. UYPR2.512]UIF88521.1 hypothetical protein KAF44_24485 [Cupriavidus necator]